MVTGALAKNRRNKKSAGYKSGTRLKILSGDDITLEKIYSRHKNGCLVSLENFTNSGENVIVDNVDFEKRHIGIAFPSLEGNICWAIYKFNGLKSSDYVIERSFGIISSNHYKYNQLNEKLKRINQN